MSSVYRLLPHYTYEDYLHWEGQWELIEGIPYAMSPMPCPEHQAIAGNLHAELRASLKSAGCNCKVYQPIDYKIADDTILNPDLLVVCQPITKAFLDFAPELVVEILSPATALKDRHTKFDIYETQQVSYYVIVDVDQKLIEVYRLSEDRKYQKQELDPKTAFQFKLPSCTFDLVFDTIWS